MIDLYRKFEELKNSKVAAVQLEKEMDEVEKHIGELKEERLIEVCLSKKIHPLSLIMAFDYEELTNLEKYWGNNEIYTI